MQRCGFRDQQIRLETVSVWAVIPLKCIDIKSEFSVANRGCSFLQNRHSSITVMGMFNTCLCCLGNTYSFFSSPSSLANTCDHWSLLSFSPKSVSQKEHRGHFLFGHNTPVMFQFVAVKLKVLAEVMKKNMFAQSVGVCRCSCIDLLCFSVVLLPKLVVNFVVKCQIVTENHAFLAKSVGFLVIGKEKLFIYLIQE